MAKSLRDAGEDALVAQLVAGLSSSEHVVVGPGDDCAVLRLPGARDDLLLKTDCVVEGVHFLASAAPSRVGWKAMARAISDIAAMGGAPCAALVTVVLPASRPLAYVRALYRGIERAAAEFGAPVVGGETSSGPEGVGLGVISVSLAGSVARGGAVLRSGARPGDHLFVTGRLGGASKGRHLAFRPRVAEGNWLRQHARASAMMDLSDGLAKDLPRLARSSGVGVHLDRTAVPRARGATLEAALGEGEDYELLCAIPERAAYSLPTRWAKAFPAIPLTAIGRVVENASEDDDSASLAGGWDHFAPTKMEF